MPLSVSFCSEHRTNIFFPLKTKDLCQTLSKHVNTSEAMAAHLCSSELRGSGNSSLRFRGTAHEFNFWQLEVHMNGRPEVIKLVNARGENVGLIQPSHIILILHGRCKVCQIQFSLKFCSAKLALLNPHVAPVAALKAVTSQWHYEILLPASGFNLNEVIICTCICTAFCFKLHNLLKYYTLRPKLPRHKVAV